MPGSENTRGSSSKLFTSEYVGQLNHQMTQLGVAGPSHLYQYLLCLETQKKPILFLSTHRLQNWTQGSLFIHLWHLPLPGMEGKGLSKNL